MIYVWLIDAIQYVVFYDELLLVVLAFYTKHSSGKYPTKYGLSPKGLKLNCYLLVAIY